MNSKDEVYDQEKEELEYQEHDGGMMFLPNGLFQFVCECPVVGTVTNDLKFAQQEKAAHYAEVEAGK